MTVVTAFLAVTHVELGPVLPNVDLVAKEVEMGSVWAIVGDALMLTIEVFVFGKCFSCRGIVNCSHAPKFSPTASAQIYDGINLK